MISNITNEVFFFIHRYGFVLERYTESIAKHYLHYFNNSYTTIDNNIRRWSDVAATREVLLPPGAMSAMNGEIAKRNHEYNRNGNMMMMHRRSISDDSVSLHTSKDNCGNFNIPRFSTDTLPHIGTATTTSSSSPDDKNLRIALYTHSPTTGDNQLDFTEGDTICLIGESSNGEHLSKRKITAIIIIKNSNTKYSLILRKDLIIKKKNNNFSISAMLSIANDRCFNKFTIVLLK
jgi:hypothetical protein